MMEDLSLHVLDIAENAVAAGATRITILINENEARDLLTIRISDNGPGMTKEAARRALDPFFTTKGKRTGLGLPLLAQAAEQCGGGRDDRGAARARGQDRRPLPLRPRRPPAADEHEGDDGSPRRRPRGHRIPLPPPAERTGLPIFEPRFPGRPGRPSPGRPSAVSGTVSGPGSRRIGRT